MAHEALISEKSAIIEQALKEKERSFLEEEFGNLRDKIAEKLNQAAALAQEVADMAESCQKDFSDLKQECQPLFSILENNGWRDSSVRC